MSEADPRHASGTYRLEPEATPPDLPGTVVVRRDVDQLLDALASDLLMQAHACARKFGSFHLALSGGSTPMPFYMRIMTDPQYRGLPWDKTHLWIVDERCVPIEDERSNFNHISGYIVEHSGIPRSHVHPIRAMEADADVRYEHELLKSLAQRPEGHDRLDFVLLGMGGDAHTASLFPHSPALHERDRLVVFNRGPSVTPPDRVTVTYRVLNASRFVGVLVTGAGKREAIARVERAALSGNEGSEALPILGVRPVAGELRWYLDSEACPESGPE
jgi:6-phosphogluconolactonase